jgi:hypothetical protein
LANQLLVQRLQQGQQQEQMLQQPFSYRLILLQVLVLLDTKRSGYVDLALLIMSLLALW